MPLIASPPRGWYPDPADRAGLRFWDGTAWTGQTADAVAPPAEAVPSVEASIPQGLVGSTEQPAAGEGSPSTPAPGRSRFAILQNLTTDQTHPDPRTSATPSGTGKPRSYLSGLLGAAILLFLIAGLFEVAAGGSGKADPNAFTSGPSTSIATPSAGTARTPVQAGVQQAASLPTVPLSMVPPGPCAGHRVPSALFTFLFLRGDRLPVSAIPSAATAEPPASGVTRCSIVSFSDARGRGTNQVSVYASAAEAAQIAAGPAAGAQSLQAVGPTVLALDPSLSEFRSAYAAAIAQFNTSAGGSNPAPSSEAGGTAGQGAVPGQGNG